MKVVERIIPQFLENIFFTPIRDKIEYAKILAFGARHLLLNMPVKQEKDMAKIKLIVDKMSRLFVYKGTKFYSVSFPFTVSILGEEVTDIASYSGKKVDSKSISAIIAILESYEFKLNPSLIDFYIEPGSIDSAGLFLLEEIFLFEPSYIRYDFDEENQNGKLHPLNHLDINYSQYSTFKLGLKNTISDEYFENLQNTKTDCSFVVD